MKQLTHILLAGTIVPALALMPLLPAFAQTPDQRDLRAQDHQHRDGGDRAPAGGNAGKAEHRQGASRQDAQQGGLPRVNRGAAAADMHRGDPRLPGGPSRVDDMPRDHKPMQSGGAQKTARPDRVLPDEARSRDERSKGKISNEGRDHSPIGTHDLDRRVAPPDATAGDHDAGQPRHVGDDRRREPGSDVGRVRDPALPRQVGVDDRRNKLPRQIGPTGIAIGVGAGFAAGMASGFLPATNARRLDDLRQNRREIRTGDGTFIREPGRTIIEQGSHAFVVHDENDRFRALGLDVHRERRGAMFVDTVTRPGGIEILTFTDIAGRLLRRVRRTTDGREFVLIDNGDGGRRYADDIIDVPPPPLRIPRDRYVVDYRVANEGLLYDTLIAPPLAPPPRRYTLDEIRYSPGVRSYVRSIDINTISFDTGSWDVPAAATGQLQALGSAVKRAIDRNPNSVFLVEGFTDATGNPDDNLSLSDRRAQSVAEILTKAFGVPPENLTTQGYGQQNPIENTPGPSAVNRRVVVQNITQLLASGGQLPAEQ